MKRIIIIVILSLMTFSCLFALNWFNFSLNLEIVRLCQPLFWQTGTTTEIENNEVNLMPLIGNASFATLGLAYKGNVNISVDIGYSPFYRLESENDKSSFNTSEASSYTLDFRQPDSESSFVFGQDCGKKSPMTSAHYGNQVEFDMYRLLNNVNPSNIGTASVSNGISLVKVCDFYVDELDLGDATSGNYLSLLICQVTVE